MVAKFYIILLQIMQILNSIHYFENEIDVNVQLKNQILQLTRSKLIFYLVGTFIDNSHEETFHIR